MLKIQHKSKHMPQLFYANLISFLFSSSRNKMSSQGTWLVKIFFCCNQPMKNICLFFHNTSSLISPTNLPPPTNKSFKGRVSAVDSQTVKMQLTTANIVCQWKGKLALLARTFLRRGWFCELLWYVCVQIFITVVICKDSALFYCNTELQVLQQSNKEQSLLWHGFRQRICLMKAWIISLNTQFEKNQRK